MESFILRIYRHEQKNSGELIGTLEHVGTGSRMVFRYMDELWKILVAETNCAKNKVSDRGKEYSTPNRLRMNLEVHPPLSPHVKIRMGEAD